MNNFKLPLLYEVLLKQTTQFIEESKKEVDTTSFEFLEKSYLYWDPREEKDEGFKEVVNLLCSDPYKSITHRNLALANPNSDWKQHPIEWFIADYLNDFLNYLIPRIINLKNWPKEFDDFYRDFEGEYLSDEIKVEFFGHLANFVYHFSSTGEINDHTEIVVLSRIPSPLEYLKLSEEKADYFRVKSGSRHCFPRIDPTRLDAQHYYLKVSKKFPKETIGKQFNFYYLMRKFVLAVRLLCCQKYEKPFCDFIVGFYQGNLSQCSSIGSTGFPENEIGDKFSSATFDGPSIDWMRRLWAKLENIDFLERLVAFDHHLDDALRRGTRSEKNPYANELKIADELDRLSDYFSAFDSLYKDTKGRTGEIIASYTSKLVTYKRNPSDQRDPNQSNVIKEFMVEMYKIRNDYEHGRYKDAVGKAGKLEAFEANVFRVGYFLRQVAIIYIMTEDFEAQLPKILADDFSGLKNVYY